MADEITTYIGFSVLKGLFDKNFPIKSVQFDWTGTNYSENVQSIGTSAEALDVSADIGTAGIGFFYNLDDAVTITISTASDGTNPLISLAPGQMALLPLATKTIYAKASTSGGPDLQYVIVEA